MATSVRVTWAPSTDASVINAGFYTIQSAPDVAGVPGSWAFLANVSDVRPGANYSGGLFFYVDAAGSATTWYKVMATDGGGLTSPYGAPFQTGLPFAIPTAYTSEALITAIKRRGNLPSADALFTTTDFLALADEETLTNLLPQVLGAAEDYFLVSQDATLTASGTVRIPKRAIGAKLHSVNYLDSSGTEVEIPRLQANDTEHSFGYYVRSGYLVLINQAGVPVTTLRLRYFLRPAQLVPSDQVAYVTGFDTVAKTVTVGLLPTGFFTGLKYDLVKGGSPYDTLAQELIPSISGQVLTFTVNLPDGLEVGDIICPAGQANVVQLPAEYFPVLAQAVAVKCMEAMGDAEGAGIGTGKLEQAKSAALDIVSSRIDGAPEIIAPPGHSPWRSR